MEVSNMATITLLVVLSLVYCIEATVCRADSDCGAEECCYIKPQFEVVSKRRQVNILPVLPVHSDTGVCERYRIEHEQCGPLEKANGHCGCGPGLSCQFVPAEIVTAPILQPVSKKRSIYMPGPGTIECKRI